MKTFVIKVSNITFYCNRKCIGKKLSDHNSPKYLNKYLSFDFNLSKLYKKK
jgi:hypothetical protein